MFVSVFYYLKGVFIVIKLTRIKENELKQAFFMMKKGFFPTFVQYHDRINPIFQSYGKFRNKYNKSKMYWIVFNGDRVGEISLGVKDSQIHLSNFFILSEYQNRGIGQQVLRSLEDMYSADIWHLFTIKEERRNIHLYEKFGFIPSGVEHKINKRMTLVEYEKRK